MSFSCLRDAARNAPAKTRAAQSGSSLRSKGKPQARTVAWLQTASQPPRSLHRDLPSFELNLPELGLTDNFHLKDACAPRPLLHAPVRFQGQPARGVIPPQPNPTDLRVGVVPVAETLAIVVVESECAIRPGMDAQHR